LTDSPSPDSPSPDSVDRLAACGPHPIQLHPSIRVGSVSYLNAAPLTYGLGSAITMLQPSRLAAELRAGRLDVALVPLMEVLEAPPGSYRVANGVGIGAEQAVYSVYLHHTVPVAEIRTVALDPASKTSVELARLVLEKFHGLTPRYVTAEEPADAKLLIGDAAIRYRQAHPEAHYLDLATAWRESTGLPFVFAVWAIRLPLWRALPVAFQLRRAAKIGLQARNIIAQTPFEVTYLTGHLCYELGEGQKKAIRLFSKMLAESGQIESAPKLTYL
jgi:chorismate dehydratase